MTGEQRDQWRKALAAQRRASHRGAGRRRTGLAAADGPGRIRKPPPPEDTTMTTPDHDQAGDDTGAGDETTTMEITGPVGTTPPPHSASQARRITAADGEA